MILQECDFSEVLIYSLIQVLSQLKLRKNNYLYLSVAKLQRKFCDKIFMQCVIFVL